MDVNVNLDAGKLGAVNSSVENSASVGGLGIYLIAVGYHDNAKNLFTEISKESRFLKFGAALLILNYSIDNFLPAKFQTGAKIFMWTSLILNSKESGSVIESLTNLIGK